MKKKEKALSAMTKSVKGIALSASKHSLNSACVYFLYQPKMPKSLKKN